MKIYLTILLFSISMCLMQSALAYDSNGMYIPWGLGAAKCNVFLHHAKNDEDGKNELIYMQWFNGYFTGVNAAKKGNKDFSSSLSRESLYDSVINKCNSNKNLSVESVLYQVRSKFQSICRVSVNLLAR